MRCEVGHRPLVASKSNSDALPRATAEGKISETRELLTCLSRPTVWVKTHRIFEKSGIVMKDPLAHDDIRSAWYAVAFHCEFVSHFTRKTPGGRIKSHRFLDHTIRIN